MKRQIYFYTGHSQLQKVLLQKKEHQSIESPVYIHINMLYIMIAYDLYHEKILV